MIKEEKINRRKAFERVNENIYELKQKSKTIKSIYEIAFKHLNFTFLNVINNVGYEEITYAKANEEIKKYATYFQNVIPRNEKYVGICLSNSKEWIYVFFALLMVNFIPTLLNNKNKDDQNLKVIDKLNIKTIIIDKFIDKKLKHIYLEDIEKSTYQNLKENWANEIVFLSSGTTGENKIVSFNGEELVKQIENAVQIIKENKLIIKTYEGYFKQLLILPLHHIFGLFATFLWFIFFNVTFVLPINLNPLNIRQAILLSHATHIFAVPLFWKTIEFGVISYVKSANKEKAFNKAMKISSLIQSLFPISGPKFIREVFFKKYLDKILGPSITYTISGGAYINKETLKLINSLGYPLFNGYGATEIGITSLITSNKYKDRLDNNIGKPFLSIIYDIKKNKDGVEELYVKGDSISHHQFKENSWKEFQKDEYVTTNDSVIFINQKYYLKGRLDEIITKENGENFSLLELENSLKLNYCDSLLCFLDDDKIIKAIISYEPYISKYQINKDLKRMVENKFDSRIQKFYLTRYIFPKVNEIKTLKKNVIKKFHENKALFEEINLNDIVNIKEDKNIIDPDILKEMIEIFSLIFDNKEVNENTRFYEDLNGDSLKYYFLLEKIKNKFNIDMVIKEKPFNTPKEFAKEIMKEISK